MKNNILAFLLAIFVFSFAPITTLAQTTEFTYQGRLTNSTGTPLTGNYDFEFKLYDALTAGALLATQQKLGVAVSNGTFTVNLDFGSQFGGTARFLEIAVKSGMNPFTNLTPRQPVTSAPYSIRSLNAGLASDSSRLGGVTASNYVQTTDARLSDARPPTAGSGNYVQNLTTVQPGTTNFNINGSGTANVFNAGSQFNIAGSRVLSVAGNFNLFVGAGSGAMNSTGTDNTFIGYNAGKSNSVGVSNTFVGATAGDSTFGHFNTFVGWGAGESNGSGSNNTVIGGNAQVLHPNLQFATAIGSNATVETSDTIVLGRSSHNDTVEIPGKLVVETLGTAGGTPLCRNSLNQIAPCSASLADVVSTTAQNEQIKKQQAEIEQLRQEIQILKKLVCVTSANKDICKEEK